LQGCCNAKHQFTHIHVGYPGSCHDARVFRASSIYEAIQNNPRELFPDDRFHILADSAYPISKYVLTPFKDFGTLSQYEKVYNVKLAKARTVIEHCFGLLKGRWRKLQCVDCHLDFVPYVITTACVLHNICEIYEGSFEEWYDSQDSDLSNSQIQVRVSNPVLSQQTRDGQEKRGQFVAYFQANP
jgi:hypothetical protein